MNRFDDFAATISYSATQRVGKFRGRNGQAMGVCGRRASFERLEARRLLAVLNFSALNFDVFESQGAATIVVTRSEGSGVATVDFKTSDGTAQCRRRLCCRYRPHGIRRRRNEQKFCRADLSGQLDGRGRNRSPYAEQSLGERDVRRSEQFGADDQRCCLRSASDRGLCCSVCAAALAPGSLSTSDNDAVIRQHNFGMGRPRRHRHVYAGREHPSAELNSRSRRLHSESQRPSSTLLECPGHLISEWP